MTSKANFPLIPLRELIVFPSQLVSIYVGRSVSTIALDQALSSPERRLLVATQINNESETPSIENMYPVGCLVNILQVKKSRKDYTCLVEIEGVERAKISSIRYDEAGYYVAEYSKLRSKAMTKLELKVLSNDKIIYLLKKLSQITEADTRELYLRAYRSLSKETNTEKLVDSVAALLGYDISGQAQILASVKLADRFEHVLALLKARADQIQLERSVRERVKKQIETNQREYYLTEQAKAIQKELNKEDVGDELNAYDQKIKQLPMNAEIKDKCRRELVKLKSMPNVSAETTVVRSYLEWILKLPWGQRSASKINVKRCQTILNRDHYGLEEVKERILEYLAVSQKVNSSKKAPVLCLVGPPGVGKTSLARSIAEAVGRKYVRFSLGGLRDEAEIRGHRRTYIGSMPGKIIQNICKAGTNNPVILLDEIDKMSSDFRGDPGSALLEVLDPEQNNKFNDLYLEVDYDLSEVMFICTANSLNIAQPLLDRMEIIKLNEYTEDEKYNIAKSYLLPKQIQRHGFNKGYVSLSESAYKGIVRSYTREAGVRMLEKSLAKILRKIAYWEATGDAKHKKQSKAGKISINAEQIESYLGQPSYKRSNTRKDDAIGVVTGLAWTMFGGETLTIEALLLQGKGEIILTGSLGDVMKESIRTAVSIVRSRAYIFKLESDFPKKYDFHIHIPQGATPKDGPSAGVGICIALLSSLASIPVRADVAMTGEVTLRGSILPVGGVKEKLLAAYREGIKTVIIPSENIADLNKLSDKVKNKLSIIPVNRIEEAIKIALIDVPDSVDLRSFSGLHHNLTTTNPPALDA